MSLQDFDLVRFMLLVLPGLWGLWTYKTFIKKSTEDVQWDKDLVMALSFGLPGYLLAEFITCIPFLQFLLVTIASLGLGALMGGLALIKGVRPTYWIANFLCRRTGRSVETPHGRGLAYTLHSLIEPHKNKKNPVSQIATVYNVSAPEKKEIGVLLYYDERSNEIVTDTRPPFTQKDIQDNHWENDPWVKSMNLDSGLVVEIANVRKKFVDEAYAKYEEDELQKFNSSSANPLPIGSSDYWSALASEQEALLDQAPPHL